MKINLKDYALMIIVFIVFAIWAYGYGKDAANREVRNNKSINKKS